MTVLLHLPPWLYWSLVALGAVCCALPPIADRLKRRADRLDAEAWATVPGAVRR